jgi:hypothetical protein
MIVLNTKGLHLNDLLRQQLKSPIAWQVTGLKVFVSAWNFRADLITLREEFNTFLKSNGYEQDVVSDVLTLMD